MPDHKSESGLPLSCKLIQHGKYRGWVEMPRFALVDEHTYYDEEPEFGEDGEPVRNAKGEVKKKVVPITLDQQELQRITDTCNGRTYSEYGTGDYCPVAVGHTKDKLPTKFQPEIVGYIKDFAVEPFINDVTGKPVIDKDTGKPKLAIYATPFAEAKNLEQFLNHPRRSIELRYREGTIDPLSILSSETPARDLGLHKFSAALTPEREKPYRYSINDTKQVPEQSPMADEVNKNATGAEVFEDARWKKMEAAIDKLDKLSPALEKLAAMLDGAPEGGDAGAPGMDHPVAPDVANPDAGQHDDLLGPAGSESHDMPESGHDDYGDEPFDLSVEEPEDDKDKDKDKEEPHKKAAYCSDESEHKKKMAASAPGVGNVSMPNFEGKKKMSANTAGLEEPIKEVQDRQNKARFAKLEQELTDVKNQLKLEREEKELAKVQALLSGLDAEGVDYDAAYELPRLVRMSKEEQTAHVEYMRKKYQKAVPGGGKIPVPNEGQAPQRFSRADQVKPVNSTDGATGAEIAAVAREMTRDKNLSKDAALAKVRGVPSGDGVVKVR